MTERVKEQRAHRHPTPRDYVNIGVILAVVTALEVGIYYFPIGPLTNPTLVLLMMVKFAMVVLWYMHLRFDTPFLTRVFLVGIVLAVTLYLVVLSTFGLVSLPFT